MNLAETFMAEFKRMGVWSVSFEFVEDYWEMNAQPKRRVLMEPAFRIANSFREVILAVAEDGVHYRAGSTKYGARAACSPHAEIRGEEGIVSRDLAFSLVTQYLAGAGLDAISVNRTTPTNSYRSITVLVQNAFSDEFWKSLSSSGIVLPAFVAVTPKWHKLPLRVSGCPQLTLSEVQRDPAIGISGLHRGIGFQRVIADIQYCLYQRDAGAPQCKYESGTVLNVSAAVEFAAECFTIDDLSRAKSARSILERMS